MSTPQPRTIPNALQLTINISQGGQPAAVVLGALTDGSGTASSKEAGDVWLQEAWTRFRALIHQSVACTGGVLREVAPDGEVWDLAPPTLPTGSDAGNNIALASGATLLKWKTAKGGRSGKGRTFLPGLPAAAVFTDGRTVLNTWVGAASTVAEAYRSSSVLTGQGLTPAVLSFKTLEAYPITSGVCAPIVGMQRRRMRA